MDIKLVNQGFHLAYFDVSGKFGCPDAVERAEQFYWFLVNERGLNAQASMEGVSRGGLFVYNWAAKHPSRVASIYCDTPVCDFRSWPGGKKTGIGSSVAWKECLAAYGLSEQQAMTYNRMPIDHAEIIAEAKIPVMHIVSENDRVVPPGENTYRLRDKLQAAGHDMQVIRVAEGTTESKGHHFDHPDPQSVIDFFNNNRPR
jgi:sialidase-1